MAPILNSQQVNLNGGNSPGNTTTPGAAFSNKVTAAVSGGNTQLTGSNNSANALAHKGVMKLTPGGKGMFGGGRSRSRRHRHRRSHSSRHGSKKYARKRSLRHRLKHRKSGRRGHGHGHTKRRGHRGGAGSYSSNVALTFGQKFPGFPLSSKDSALAIPTPFMPYSNCVGGK